MCFFDVFRMGLRRRQLRIYQATGLGGVEKLVAAGVLARQDGEKRFIQALFQPEFFLKSPWVTFAGSLNLLFQELILKSIYTLNPPPSGSSRSSTVVFTSSKGHKHTDRVRGSSLASAPGERHCNSWRQERNKMIQHAGGCAML